MFPGDGRPYSDTLEVLRDLIERWHTINPIAEIEFDNYDDMQAIWMYWNAHRIFPDAPVHRCAEIKFPGCFLWPEPVKRNTFREVADELQQAAQNIQDELWPDAFPQR